MITIRIEFYNDNDRKALIDHITEKYIIVKEDNIKESKNKLNKCKIQYLLIKEK